MVILAHENLKFRPIKSPSRSRYVTAEMDGDVISIEASRSDMELFDVAYPNEIGPEFTTSIHREFQQWIP